MSVCGGKWKLHGGGQGDGSNNDDEAKSKPVPSFMEALCEHSCMLMMSRKETKQTSTMTDYSV
jgi:hypothetical protein